MVMAQMGVLESDQADRVVLDASPGHRRAGLAALAVGLGGCTAWTTWRIATIDLHPVPIAFLLAELVGLAAAVVVGVALSKAGDPRTVYAVGGGERDCHWFAHAVADIVGRTRSADVHRDVRTAMRAAPRWRPRDTADAAVAAVLAEGPRRLVLVVTAAAGLLLGVAPFAPPPWWALGGAVVGYGAFAASHVLLGRRRLRFGDRQRWSYGAIGEIVSRDDVAGHAPRSWIGAIAVAVALSVTVALRGMSDRWTHGLPPMTYDERVVALVVAVVLVAGALHTVFTTPRPQQPDAHLVSRRLEEANTRHTLLAAAVCIGVVGLLAGVIPTSDAVDGTPGGSTLVEQQANQPAVPGG
jgi:hypothetical protein